MPPPSRVPGETRLNPAGKDPATSVDEVFDVWLKVHTVVRSRCLEEPEGPVRDRLLREVGGGDLEHLNLHARQIERLLELSPDAIFKPTPAEEERARRRRRRPVQAG